MNIESNEKQAKLEVVPGEPGDTPEQPRDNPEQPGDIPAPPLERPEQPGDTPEQPVVNTVFREAVALAPGLEKIRPAQ
jgi:hypothetical protein